ncbi:MAG: HDIG domain-containing protein [Bacteroidetes bacterium]|nr:MAG: HDIG domain-containing protein [Bacteroidota bacterium]
MTPISSPLPLIQSLYLRYGQEAYGEGVTQLAHAYQAAQLARQAGYPPAVVVAAFLHDVGHLYAQDQPHEDMAEFGVMSHDRIGADWLRQLGFPKPVPELVEGHVQAKRYLTWAEPGYFDALSAASQATLGYQGGPMDEEEASAFREQPWFNLSLKMRHWDDEAKVENQQVPSLEDIWDMVEAVWASGQA